MKKCNVCLEERNLSEFFSRKAKNGDTRYDATCKKCRRKAYREAEKKFSLENECSVEGCGRPATKKKYVMCNMHAQRVWRTGDPGPADPIHQPAGSGYIQKDGYRVIYVDGIPWREHRYLLQQYLGRDLLPTETVHHKNGDRSDNRLENLELWSTSQPPGQSVQDKVEWAMELLKLYKPNYLIPLEDS